MKIKKDKIPVKQKIVYGMGSINDMWGDWLYPSMVWPVFNIFLHVNPTLVSLALMINRLVDGFTDPIFGWCSDNIRTRFGRSRPYILVGSIFAGICFPLLFMVSPSWSENKIFWYMVVSSGVMVTIVSSFNMPYQSLGNEMTPDYNEKTSVFAYKGVLQKVGEGAMFFASAFVTLSIFNDPNTGEPNVLFGARVYAVIIGISMIIIGVVLFVCLQERYYHKIVEKQKAKTSISETLWKTLKCKPFFAQLAMALSYGIGTSMVGSLGYYITIYYVCGGEVALGSKWNFAMGIANMIFGLLGVIFYSRLSFKIGKRHAMMAVQFSAIVAFATSWFLYNPDFPWLQLLAAGSIAFTQGGFWMLCGALGADVIDYDELDSGKRREGAFAACATYIMKVGLAIGLGLSGVVLSSTGFDAKLGKTQSPEALQSIRILFLFVPIVGLSFSFLCLRKFGLSKEKMESIRLDLEAKRGSV